MADTNAPMVRDTSTAAVDAQDNYFDEITENGNSRIDNIVLPLNLSDRLEGHIHTQLRLAFEAGKKSVRADTGAANDHADQAMAERAAQQATIAALTARVAELEGYRPFIVGANHGYETAMRLIGESEVMKCVEIVDEHFDSALAALARAALTGEKGE